MADSFGSRLKNAWNVFLNRSPTRQAFIGEGYSTRQDRMRYKRGNERTIMNSICNRIAMDVAGIGIHHVKLDDDGRYTDEIESGLDRCLGLEANEDQTGRAFIQDAVASMLDEGCIAIVPTDIDWDPETRRQTDILTLRVGKILAWYPAHVDLEVYNARTGRKEEIRMEKRRVAIIENPLYSVMNEPNSTMQRLIWKLNLLDAVDEQSSSGKLDLIIQLPYTVKSPLRKEQAAARLSDIEQQLTGSKYGIAYADATEKITQLNRPVENNLMKQVEYLTSMLYSQLGVTQAVMDGTADEKTMLNYHNRSIEPILAALVDEMNRKFLDEEARKKKEAVRFFRDPFKLVPVNNLAEIADKLTRNEILTSNEVRQIIGMKPAKDPAADELRNKNLNQSGEDRKISEQTLEEKVTNQNGDET